MKSQNILQKKYIPSQHLKKLLEIITQNGGLGILVGGCVRDHILNLNPTDIDIEIYNLEINKLEKVLRDNFEIHAVGKSFGIFKVGVNINNTKKYFDVALPRTESKTGPGHKNFHININSQIDFKQAALRRDFTINSMGINISSQELLDPHGGYKDLKNKILKHTSPAFAEDPLRVLRAAQFCARFDLKLDQETINLCHKLKQELSTLSIERIYEEIKKLLLAPKPSLGFEVLKLTEALYLFPELEKLIGCKQDPEWHPEGDVWVHTNLVINAAANLIKNSGLAQDEKIIIMLGALCHDLGKPATYLEADNRIKSPGHEQAGVPPTLSLLTRMGIPKKFHDYVCDLVREHLKPFQLYKVRDHLSDGAIRRLCTRVDISRLLYVSQADFLGRTTPEALLGHDPSAQWLKDRVEKLLGTQKKPRQIILGRHLISLGLTPGVKFAQILQRAFEAQLDGQFIDEPSGLKWVKEYLSIKN